MNERSHKWTWDDFFPPPRERSEVESDLLACMIACPESIDRIRRLQIPIQFSKPLHWRIFKQIDEMALEDRSIEHAQMLSNLVAAANRNNDCRMLKNLMALSRAFSKPPTSNRAVELAKLIAELD